MRALRILLLVAAAAIAGLLGWQFAVDPDGAFERRMTLRGPGAAPETVPFVGAPALRLADIPDYRPVLDAFRTLFPADYTRFVEDAGPAPDRARLPDSDLADALGRLRRARGALAAKAADNRLADVLASQVAMADALAASDTKLCVGFLYGTPGAAFGAFVAQHRDLMAGLAAAQIAAIADGQARRLDRPPPSDADFAQVEDALTARGLSQAEIGAVLDGRWPDPPLPDARMCEAGRAYLAAIRALPDPLRARIAALMVDLMARS